ncbi:MAG: redox-sensing transcriptional repressor Rex [Planctomycetes bacterium]|nr:redox-sensing transcriptional repressor Rex [Planctomycetota bacterium]
MPSPAVRRLSLYLRQLEAFLADHRRTVSSKQLGEALGLSDAQVRKDLAYFGQFGQAGIGYRVPDLIGRIRRIFGTDKVANILLAGVGNLGRALLLFRGFAPRGFDIVAAFDNDPAKIGMEIGGPGAVRVQPLSEMGAVTRARSIRVGIVAVPAFAAQSVADEMVAVGIRGILNFAPIQLQIASHVAVSSVDLAVHLEQLSFLTHDTET